MIAWTFFYISFDKKTNNIVNCHLGRGIQRPGEELDLMTNIEGVEIE
jgi:hypothetical protein